MRTLLLSACKPMGERAQPMERPEDSRYPEDSRRWLMSLIQYVRDSRTGLCFAYLSDGHSEVWAPALATVPCEAVPPAMLSGGAER